MRVYHGSYADNFVYNKRQIDEQIQVIERQVATKKKIEYGYQGVREFSNTLLLDYEETTIKQVIDTSNKSLQLSKSTDNAISDMKVALDTFKTKLIFAANNEHSLSSYEAIAKELEGLKEHIKSIANTSIDGRFLFSGTKTSQIPINDNGEYLGNNGTIDTIVGSNHRVRFNIPGSDLFFGNDTERRKIITTNVQKFNQSKLHPYSMTEHNKSSLPEKVHITEKDKIRDLVGDNDDDDTNDPVTVFYVSGTKKTGQTFKRRVNLAGTEDISTLLTKIESLYDYGVDAKINKYGLLEVKDKTNGSSRLDFHIVGATDFNAAPSTAGNALQNDIDDLSFNSLHITEFLRSKLKNTIRDSSINAVKDPASVSDFNINTSFINNDNTSAKADDLLQDFFPANVTSISFTGQTVSNPRATPPTVASAVNTAYNITPTSTINDLMVFIKNNYDDDGISTSSSESIHVYLDNGKIKIEDRTIEDKTVDVSTFSLGMVGRDVANAPTDTFSVLDSILNDRFYFSVNGSTLTSNVSQVSKVTDTYANGSTLIQDVAGADILGRQLVMNVVDINGVQKTINVDFTDTPDANGVMSTFSVGGVRYPVFQESWQDIQNGRNLPLTQAENALATATGFNANDNDKMVLDSAEFNNASINDYIEVDGQYRQITSIDTASVAGKSLITVDSNYTYLPPNQPATVSLPLEFEKVRLVRAKHTDTSNFSYKQLENIVSMVVSDTLPSAGASDRFPEWNSAVEGATNLVDVSLNTKGRLQIRDNNNSPTRVRFEMHTALSDNFDPTDMDAIKEPFMSFQSNNALIIDEPKITLFETLNRAIDSTRRGISRPDASNGFDPRDLSVQNYIEQIDHLMSHVGLQHTKAGTQSQTLSMTVERSQLQLVETNRIREEILNTDVTSAYTQFKSLQLSLQAILAQIAKVQNLSLVNYYN
jgi:flagellar hook-associated protein 3 FlgL